MILWIDEQRLKHNVLVHCFAGVSRSASTVIAYLMKKLNWDLRKAYNYTRDCRNIINPNPGFYR